MVLSSCSSTLNESDSMNSLSTPKSIELQTTKVYAEKIIELTTQILMALFPDTNLNPGKNLLNIKCFVQEFLKKSKSNFSTLQLSLLYIINLKKTEMFRDKDSIVDPIFKCGRRIFLFSLIIASKITLEPSPKNIAWSKLSGLPIKEINQGERLLLQAMNYKVTFNSKEFSNWINLLESN